MPESLGFVGVGNMGGRMAHRLLDAGHTLTVYDIRAAAIAPLAARGARRAASSRAVADETDIVFFSLPEPADVEAEALNDEGVIAGTRAKTLVDLSTTGPRTIVRIHERLSPRGITLIDAPVSGGVAGAEKGTLAVMASGAPADVARMAPMLALFGQVFRIGDTPGMGQTMKLANNLLSAAAMAITAEAMVMGVKAGLDPKLMLEVINAGTGRNTATEGKFPKAVLPRRFDYGFATGLMHKDVRLCLEEGDALGVPMEVGRAVRAMWKQALDGRGAQSDFTEIVRCLETRTGVEVKSKGT